MAKKLQIEIVGDASSFLRASKQTRTAAGTMGGALGKVGKIAGFAAGGAALGGIAVVLKQGIPEWKESTQVTAQTGAVIKSTGGIANVSAKQVDQLANSILAKTGIDDEAVKSGENMLLTFTNIRNEAGKGNDVFNQTTKTLTDMATAMNGGATPSAEQMRKQSILLGKALNDPTKGLAALKRVGVSFTEAQKDQIAAMQASGDTMGAQKLILGELNKEFGGSAEAAGKTLPGQLNILKETFNNLAGELVSKLVPSLTAFAAWASDHMPQIEATMGAVFDGIAFLITDVVGPALEFLIAEGQKVVVWFQANWPQILAIFHQVMDPIVAWVQTNWPKISLTVTNVMQTVQTVITTTVTWAKAFWGEFGASIIKATEQTFAAIKSTIEGTLNVIKGIVNVIGGLIHGDWARVWQGLQQIVDGVMGVIKGLVSGAMNVLVTTVSGIAGALGAAALALGTSLKNGIVNGITGLAGLLRKAVTSALDGVIGLWNALRIPGVHFTIPGIKVAGQTIVPDIDFGWDGYDFPDIPLLAKGGLHTKTGLAVVDRGETFSGVGAHRRPLGGSGTVVNVYVSGSVTSERDLVQSIRSELRRTGWRNGTDGLLSTAR